MFLKNFSKFVTKGCLHKVHVAFPECNHIHQLRFKTDTQCVESREIILARNASGVDRPCAEGASGFIREGVESPQGSFGAVWIGGGRSGGVPDWRWFPGRGVCSVSSAMSDWRKKERQASFNSLGSTVSRIAGGSTIGGSGSIKSAGVLEKRESAVSLERAVVMEVSSGERWESMDDASSGCHREKGSCSGSK
jgi:hypothetical protein